MVDQTITDRPAFSDSLLESLDVLDSILNVSVGVGGESQQLTIQQLFERYMYAHYAGEGNGLVTDTSVTNPQQMNFAALVSGGASHFQTTATVGEVQYIGAETVVIPYKVAFSLLRTANVAHNEFKVKLRKNGLDLSDSVSGIVTANQTEHGTGALFGRVTLTTNDILSLWVENVTAANDCIFTNYSIYLGW